MFRELNTLINNELPEQDLDNFSVIIGSNPSQGARSPILWNKVYKEEKKNTKNKDKIEKNPDKTLSKIISQQQNTKNNTTTAVIKNEDKEIFNKYNNELKALIQKKSY